MAARKYSPPRTWIVNDGEWPAGPFAPDAPPYALVTAAIVRHYAAAAGSRSLRSVAREAGIDATSLGRTLAGETVPDVHTVAVLEDALGTPLWPVFAERHPAISADAITPVGLEGSVAPADPARDR